jgi:CDP-glucose 4,6-dehydratase
VAILGNLSIFDGSTVLVTGHTGFKGTWLSLWLSQLGARVSGVSFGIPSDPSHFAAAGVANRVRDVRLDIRDSTALKTVVEEVQPDFVFHLAAQALVRRSYVDPVDTWQTNAMGTINVLETLRGLTRPCVAVLITSDKCYDNVEWVWGYRETDTLGGLTPIAHRRGPRSWPFVPMCDRIFQQTG